MPEPQADVQAELMAEAFGFYADNLLTRDHFTEVLNARFAEQDERIERRLDAVESKFEQRTTALESKIEQCATAWNQRLSSAPWPGIKD